jgi:hypothetical protein
MYSKKWFSPILMMPVLASTALAAASVLGTISSTDPVELSGARISSTGKASSQLVSGDRITTTTSVAVIQLPGKDVIVLDKNSSARLVSEGGTTKLQLLEGSASYQLNSDSNVQIVDLNSNVTTSGKQGTVSTKTALANSPPTLIALAKKPPPPPPPPPKPKPKPKSKSKDDDDKGKDKDDK